MWPFLSIALTLSLVCSGFAQPVAPTVAIQPGAEVEIELLENISSEILQAGQSVPFKLVRALGENAGTLLAVGTILTGKVTSAQSAGHWGKAGAFDLKLEPMRLPDGTMVRLDFHRPAKANEHGEHVDENVRGAMLLTYYFPLIPVALIASSSKGEPFEIRAGERYLVYVTETNGSPAAGAPAITQNQGASQTSPSSSGATDDQQKVFVFVQRTDRHAKYSDAEVFHEVLYDLLDYLKAKNVAIAVDEFGGRDHAEGATPVDTVFNIARDTKASSVMYVVVDRPNMKWIKITVQCFDINGKQLWEEEASNGSAISGRRGVEASTKKLHERLDKRVGQDGLPLLAAKEAVAVK